MTQAIRHRFIEIEAHRADPADRTVPAVLSSEAPVTRFGETEILSHEPGAIDLARARDGLPLLFCHDVAAPIGVVEQVHLDGPKLRGRLRFGRGAKAAEAFDDVRDGILKSLSIGYRVLQTEPRPGGYRVTQWELLEASLVSVPADPAAGVNRQLFPESAMTEPRPELSTPSPDTLRETILAEERRRIADIREAVRASQLGDDLADAFINQGIGADEARREVLRQLAERTLAQNAGRRPPDGPVHGHALADNFRQAATDHFLSRAGLRVKNPHPAARDFQRLSVPALAELCLSRAGQAHRNLTQPELIRAALTTSDFPAILSAVGGAALGFAYSEAPVSFQTWTRERQVPDFKTQSLAKLGELPSLEEVPEHGEYTFGSLAEYAENFAVKTYGKIISLSRQAMVNDDLGAFTELTTGFGAAARRLEADLVYGKLTGNPVLKDGLPLFHADHGNLAATGAALSSASLSAARTAPSSTWCRSS